MSEAKIGIVLVTHGNAASAMLAEVERLVAPDALVGMRGVEVVHGEPRAGLLRRIGDAVTAVDEGAGVLVACDLHGSTPSNCAVELLRSGRHILVVYGINMPMLIKLATAPRTVGLEAAAAAAMETAIRSIRIEGSPK